MSLQTLPKFHCSGLANVSKVLKVRDPGMSHDVVLEEATDLSLISAPTAWLHALWAVGNMNLLAFRRYSCLPCKTP